MSAVYLGELPVWRGVQSAPGFEARAFVLKVEQGLIRFDREAVPTNDIVDRYGDRDYTFITTPPGRSTWGTLLGDWYFRELAAAVGDLEGCGVLEIGAGTDYIARRTVAELRARHYVMCDPVMSVEEGSGAVEVVPEYFAFERFREMRPNVVVSINNLEHIPDPLAYMIDVRRLLGPAGGRFFVVVPECSRGLREGDWGICVHEHFTYFTQRSFAALAAQAGFAVLDAKVIEDQLIALLSPTEAVVPSATDADAGRLAAAAVRFEANLAGFERQLATLGRGTQIGLHGCSVGLNNVLARTTHRSMADIHLFDGDEAKEGKYLPTFDRPIVSTSDPLYRTMDHVIVAPTTYFTAIRADLVTRHGFDPDRIHPMFPLA